MGLLGNEIIRELENSRQQIENDIEMILLVKKNKTIRAVIHYFVYFWKIYLKLLAK
jgi:hypothetical protein